jgi:gluconate 2-dehydrogenase gamma chain
MEGIMSRDYSVDRRQVLKSIAAGGALAKWPALAAVAGAADALPTRYAVFSPPQVLLMEALVDQIVPADDFPSANEAGVVHFIDQKLAGPYGSFFVGRYESGLTLFADTCRRQFHQDFSSLDVETQSRFLHAVAEKTYGESIHDFFQTVLSDTFEGYYGTPEAGGNRNGASWKMIGFKG